MQHPRWVGHDRNHHSRRLAGITLRKAWIAIAVLMGLALVTDMVAHSIAQRKAGEELGRQFDLARPPDVSLEGWPFFLHLVTGEFDEVRIRAPRLEQRSIRLSDIDLRLKDVEVSLGKLFDGDPEGVRAHSGSGRASITGDSVASMLEDEGVRADVAIEAGVLFVTPEQLGRTLEGMIGLEGNVLTIRAGGGQFAFDVELPSIADGMTYDSIELRGNVAILAMSFRNAVFTPD